MKKTDARPVDGCPRLTGRGSKARIFREQRACSCFRSLLGKETGVIHKYLVIGLLGLLCAGCGGNPYLDASLDPAKFEGKDKAWFEENWGKPSGKSSRFFGGESWVYSRIAGGETRFPFFNFSPNQCHINLDFDKEGKLEDYDYTDC